MPFKILKLLSIICSDSFFYSNQRKKSNYSIFSIYILKEIVTELIKLIKQKLIVPLYLEKRVQMSKLFYNLSKF